MKGYKFLHSDYRSHHGNEDPWREGEKRTLPGPPVLTKYGYHACRDWRYCLDYLYGPVGMVVELGGEVHGDKEEIYGSMSLVVGTECTVLKIQDVSSAFRQIVREELEFTINFLRHSGRVVPECLLWTLDLLRRQEEGTVSRDALIQYHQKMHSVCERGGENGTDLYLATHRLCRAATLPEPDDALFVTLCDSRQVVLCTKPQSDAPWIDPYERQDQLFTTWDAQQERQLEHFARTMEEVFGT